MTRTFVVRLFIATLLAAGAHAVSPVSADASCLRCKSSGGWGVCAGGYTSGAYACLSSGPSCWLYGNYCYRP